MGTRAGWDHLQRITSQSMVISHYPTIQWHYMVIKCHHWIVGYNHVKLKTISLEGPFVILRLKTFMSMYQINSHRISNPASVSISILYFSAWKVKVLCPKVATVYPMDLVVHGGTSGVSGVWYGNLGPQSDLSGNHSGNPLSTFRIGRCGPWHVPRMFHNSESEGSWLAENNEQHVVARRCTSLHLWMSSWILMALDMTGLWWQQRTGQKRNPWRYKKHTVIDKGYCDILFFWFHWFIMTPTG